MKFENGYSISKGEGGHWLIWCPTGELYMECVSYSEAYEIASNLKEDVA